MRRQNRGQHAQHERGALLWVQRPNAPSHNRLHGVGPAQLGRAGPGGPRKGLRGASYFALECTPPMPVVHVPNGHAHAASPV